MGCLFADVLSPIENSPRIHPYEARNAIDERGLPRTIWADYPEDLACGHGKTDIHQCLDPAKGLLDVFDLKNGL